MHKRGKVGRVKEGGGFGQREAESLAPRQNYITNWKQQNYIPSTVPMIYSYSKTSKSTIMYKFPRPEEQ